MFLISRLLCTVIVQHCTFYFKIPFNLFRSTAVNIVYRTFWDEGRNDLIFKLYFWHHPRHKFTNKVVSSSQWHDERISPAVNILQKVVKLFIQKKIKRKCIYYLPVFDMLLKCCKLSLVTSLQGHTPLLGCEARIAAWNPEKTSF